jgi:hypothetical protein
MWRTIGAVVVGYLVMFVFVFVSFTIAFLVMGTEGAFKGGSYDVSTLWIVVSFVLGFIAALLGGQVCAMIAKSPNAPWALAVVLLLLGLAMAWPTLAPPDDGQPTTRGAEVTSMEAMQRAKQPPAVAFVNPFIGAIGVLLGGRLKSSRKTDHP